MKTIALGMLAACLLGSAAIAAPLSPTAVGPTEISGVDQVRLVELHQARFRAL